MEITKKPPTDSELEMNPDDTIPVIVEDSLPSEAETEPETETTEDEPFHIHHAIIGAGIAGASLLVLFIPQLKETTRYVVAALGVSVGAALVYDDLVQHIENKCDFSTIINFVPCEPSE